MKKLGWALLTAVLIVPSGSALGHDHRPPAAVLRYGGERVQQGFLHQYCWVIQVDGETALTECEDRIWSFPRRAVVETDHRIVIRIRKPTAPASFTLEAWPNRGDEIMGPSGKPERLTARLRPHLVDGKTVAYKAIFRVAEEGRHYFIRAFGSWPDEQGASESNQDAAWLFHVRT